MAMGHLTNSLRALDTGLLFNDLSKQDASLRAGRTLPLVTIVQSVSTYTTCNIANKVLEALSYTPMSLKTRLVISLTPVFISLAQTLSNTPEAVRKGILFAHDHLEDLLLLASTVSAVALCALGQPVYGGVLLFVLTLGILERTGALPLAVREKLKTITPNIQICTSFFFGNFISRIYQAIGLGVYALSRFGAPLLNLTPTRSVLPEQKTLLTLENLAEWINASSQVNKNYVHVEIPLPPDPDADIKNLSNMLQEISYTEQTIAILRGELETNDRFLKECGNPQTADISVLVNFVHASLAKYVKEIQEQKILEGEPTDYPRLHSYLKHITLYIQNLPQEERLPLLQKLALEGGGYCGPAKFEVAEVLFSYISGQKADLSFYEKILLALQEERIRITDGIYAETFGLHQRPTVWSKAIKVIEPQSPHQRNRFHNLYAGRFGLHRHAATSDAIGTIDQNEISQIPPVSLAMITFAQKAIEKHFWEDAHTSDTICETLQEAFGSNRLPKNEFYIFWQQWIDRQDTSDVIKEGLHDKLTDINPSFFGLPIEINGKIHPVLIRLMLLDMGILTN